MESEVALRVKEGFIETGHIQEKLWWSDAGLSQTPVLYGPVSHGSSPFCPHCVVPPQMPLPRHSSVAQTTPEYSKSSCPTFSPSYQLVTCPSPKLCLQFLDGPIGSQRLLVSGVTLTSLVYPVHVCVFLFIAYPFSIKKVLDHISLVR